MFVLQSLIFGALVSLVAFYANFLWTRRRFYELAQKIPGKKGLPLIGLLHTFAFRNYKEFLKIFSSIPDYTKSLTKFWLGPVLIVMVNSPENIQTVLNAPQCQKKPSAFYNAWQALLGMVISHGDVWKSHRKILNGAFTLKVLQRFLPMFNEKSMKSITLMEKRVNNGEFDIYEDVAACSLETLMKGNFDYDRDFQTEPHNSLLLRIVEA